MKKLLSLILIFILSLGLFGCSKTNDITLLYSQNYTISDKAIGLWEGAYTLSGNLENEIDNSYYYISGDVLELRVRGLLIIEDYEIKRISIALGSELMSLSLIPATIKKISPQALDRRGDKLFYNDEVLLDSNIILDKEGSFRAFDQSYKGDLYLSYRIQNGFIIPCGLYGFLPER